MRKTYSITALLCAIIVFFQIPAIAQTCNGTWGTPIVKADFGQGTAGTLFYGPLDTYAPGASTSTNFVMNSSFPDGNSCLTTNSDNVAQTWINMTDHTGNPNGLMFLINAPSTAATVFFEYTMNNLCPNTTLQLSLWILNVNPTSISTDPNYQYPNMSLNLIDLSTNATIATANTGDVPADELWHNYTLVFNNVSSTNVKLQIVNNSVGSGYGNDLAIDDITVSPCVPVSQLLPKLDTTVCVDATIPFSATITGNIYTPAEYQWQYSTDMGATWIDAQPAGLSPNYSLPVSIASPNTYWVRYLVGPLGFAGNSTCSGVSDTSIVKIGVKPPPPGITGTSNYCLHQPFIPLTVTGQNIKWYNSLTGGIGSPTAPVINTGVAGVYTLYASQSAPGGCESDRTSFIITVFDGVNADYNYAIHYGCGQDTVVFTNLSTDSATYKWDFGDGNVDTSKNAIHIFSGQGQYAVTLKVSGLHCTDEATQTIDTRHPLQAAFTVDHDTICAGQAITFTDASIFTSTGGAPTYAWNFGDNTSDNTASPVHTFALGGTYDVKMYITDYVPCTDTAMMKVYVDSTPFINLSGTGTYVCQGQASIFDLNYLHDRNTGVYWDFGDGTSLETSSSSVRHAYQTPGVYDLNIKATYALCPDANSTSQVTVVPYPNINVGPDTTMCPNAGPILLSDHINAGNANAHWLWNTGDTTFQIEAAQPGGYYATVTVGGCSNTDSVQVFKDCYIDIPNVFTPNGDGNNDYFFPRQFLSRSVTAFEMHIYNRWGQEIFNTKNINGRGWDGKFNDMPQPSGVFMYVIDVSYANNVTEHYQGNVTLLR